MMAEFVTSFYGGWETIAIAAAALAVIGSSMLIMLSRLFGLRNLEQIAKNEFVYAASTVFIVIMITALVAEGERLLASGDSSVVRSMYLSAFKCQQAGVVFQQETLIDWMKLYLATPTKCVQQFMMVLYGLSVPVEGMASVYMEIFMSEHASGFGVKWIAERITNTTQSLSFYMYIYYLLVHILNFVKYYAGFFFSIGVALRAFPPTRGAGAYLMAISFGLYFVFPLAYILIATMSLPHAQSDVIGTGCDRIPASDPDEVYPCALPQVASPESYQCTGASWSSLADFESRINENKEILEQLLTVRITGFVRHLISAICIFPMVALILLLTFVLNTTNLFGGNIPEIGRGLVKLI